MSIIFAPNIDTHTDSWGISGCYGKEDMLQEMMACCSAQSMSYYGEEPMELLTGTSPRDEPLPHVHKRSAEKSVLSILFEVFGVFAILITVMLCAVMPLCR
jgi:hypothetical protein